jgi:predicted transcriptional regulator of viral defense system
MPAMTARARLREPAEEHYGFVTTADATALGIDHAYLRSLARQGFLEHVGHALYRFVDIPLTARTSFMEAVLLAGPGAYLIDTGTLAMEGLALVVPERIRVGTRRRVRIALPRNIELVRTDHPPKDVTEIEGVPTVTIRRAILDSVGRVMKERLIDAAQEANEKGLIGIGEMAGLIEELRRR